MVTGASSGIGRAFAESLAARGHPLLLAARRGQRLEQLAGRLAAVHGVDARWVACDLATPDGRAACRDALDAAPTALEVLVLSAGVGSRGELARGDRTREVALAELNCVAVVDLAAHALPGPVARGRGTVVVVSSAAAWQPVPHMATYAASKAFELHLVEALAEELRGTGVRALAVCPGPTRSEFFSGAGGSPYPRLPLQRPEDVVRASWRALEHGHSRAPAGVAARLSAVSARVLPRRLVVRAAGVLHRVRR
jgi:short-subunit dehydrogenase